MPSPHDAGARRPSPSPATARGDLASRALVAVVVLACVAPFAGKAFHIDDPVYIEAARHIRAHPGDFYGSTIHWERREVPMWRVMENPPLASYYVAAASLLVGWSEVALHLAFLLPALATALGTFALARETCRHPREAALAAVATPVFVVSATTITAAMPMAACWVWAVVLWMRGTERDDARLLLGAAALVATACLVKYPAISLIPLLAAYALARTRRPGRSLLFLLIPVAAVAAFEIATAAMYGTGLLGKAAAYATERATADRSDVLGKSLVGLAFTGGCIVTSVVLLPFAWRPVAAGGLLALAAGVAIHLDLAGRLGRFDLDAYEGSRGLWILQASLFVTGGASLLAVAAADLWRRRDAPSLLLALWVVGVFVFATFVNWSVNARSVLPMLPAAAVLLVRRLEGSWLLARPWRILPPLAAVLLVALSVAWADHGLAESARTAASRIHERHGQGDATLWFQGHWGFQHYMQRLGGRPLDVARSVVAPGDVVVIPLNNSFLFPLPWEQLRVVDRMRLSGSGWLATMRGPAGAGFYSDGWGPLPYVFGAAALDPYRIHRATAPLHPTRPARAAPEG